MNIRPTTLLKIALLCAAVFVALACSATPRAELAAAENAKNLANNGLSTVIATSLYDPTPVEAQAIYNVHAAADAALDRAAELIDANGNALPGFKSTMDIAATFTQTLARLEQQAHAPPAE